MKSNTVSMSQVVDAIDATVQEIEARTGDDPDKRADVLSRLEQLRGDAVQLCIDYDEEEAFQMNLTAE